MTKPGTCGCGTPDTDSDGDGTPDCEDKCPKDAKKVRKGACGCQKADTDSDGDGAADCVDDCPKDKSKTFPGQCGCGKLETDSDGDKVADCVDECPNDKSKTKPGLCGCGTSDKDSDGDGTPDCKDECPDHKKKTEPGQCGCEGVETDSDGDGVADCLDECPNDKTKTKPGACGCGIPDTDSDGDFTADCNDKCKDDKAKTEPGKCGCGNLDSVCGCGKPETDSDGDGTPDCKDTCGLDPNKVKPGSCGCGTADVDLDADGVLDCKEICLSASLYVDQMATNITDEVIPLLQSKTFNTTLDSAVIRTELATNVTLKARESADVVSYDLDQCRGRESQCQYKVKTLEKEKYDLQVRKNKECYRAASLAKARFRMPNATHGPKQCNFEKHPEGAKCWDREYLAALQDTEDKLETAELLYQDSKKQCLDLTYKLAQKVQELYAKQGECDDIKKDCNKLEQKKTVAYCTLQTDIGELCEETAELSSVWQLLMSQVMKQRFAIRTMNITACMYTDHYSLGDNNCTGCKLGSLAECEARFPATYDFGVTYEAPSAINGMVGLFGLPETEEAATAWCKSELPGFSKKATISFPGHLWTRDASGMLKRAAYKETTTVSALCAVSA